MDFAEDITTSSVENKELSKDLLINKYLPYVKHIAYRMSINIPTNLVELDDLISAGIVGLIQAAENFDSSKNVQFITYAAFRIKGSILSELRAQDFLSRSVRKKIRELNNTYDTLEKKLCREVEDEEVAAELGFDLDELYNIKKLANFSFVSFEDIGLDSYKDKNEVVKNITCSNKNDVFDLIKLKEISSAVSEAIKHLKHKEQLVISLYYQDELTMKEIGKVLNLTESRVSQIHSQAIYCLRRKLNKKGMLDG